MNNPDRQPSSNHPSEHTPDQSREDTDSFWLNLERLIETLLWDPSALEEEYVPNVSMQHIDIPMTMPGQYPFEKAKQEARQIVQTELHDEHGRTDLHGKPRFLSDQTYRSNESTLLHNLVLEYLSQECFTSTAKILSAGHSSTPTKPGPSSHNQAAIDPQEDGDIIMSSSISDLRKIIDPSLISCEPGSSSMGEYPPGSVMTRESSGMSDVDDRDGNDVEKTDENDRDSLWLRQIQWRKTIRTNIRTGKIENAIQLVKQHFPSVLDSSRDKWTSNDRSVKSSFENGSSIPERAGPLFFPEDTVDEQAEEMSEVDGGSAETAIPDFPYRRTYNRPTFLLLNMETQSFIENVRNLGTSPSGEMDYSSMASSMHSEFGGANNGGSTGKPEEGRLGPLNGVGQTKSSRTLACLAQIQGLYAKANELLKGQEAEIFIKAIEEAGALLVYTDMDTSPLSAWLDVSRRETLAELVNRCILTSLEQPARSTLETIAKSTTHGLQILVEHDVFEKPGWTTAKDGTLLNDIAGLLDDDTGFDLDAYVNGR